MDKKECMDKNGARYYNAQNQGCRCNNGEWVSRNN